MSIDINCDVGEHEALALGIQASLMGCVTSASIACGAHAGDEALMRLTLQQAQRHGVTVGAHPGYPDRENFGRLDLDLPIAAIESSIEEQIRSLMRLAIDEGVSVRYVKPHGALYNRAARDSQLAQAIARATSRVSVKLALVGLTGSPALTVWKDAGIQTIGEAFADRRYESTGALRARTNSDAVLLNPDTAAGQALRIATRQEVVAWDGSILKL